MEKGYKTILEPKKCEHYRVFLNSIRYCLIKNIPCLCEKYGFENIKTHTVHGPYSDDVIYLCDGKLEKKSKEKK